METLSLPEPAFVYTQVPTDEPGRFEFRLCKTVDLPLGFAFPVTGHSRIFSDIQEFLMPRPHLFIIGAACSSAYSFNGCISAMNTRWGEALPANFALDTGRVIEKEEGCGVMNTDSFMLLYSAENLKLLTCMRVNALPTAVPVVRTCALDYFVSIMKTVRARYIHNLVYNSRLCLVEKDSSKPLRWKMQLTPSNVHVSWRITSVDFIVQEELHVHAFPLQKFQTFLCVMLSNDDEHLWHKLAVASREVMRVLARVYWDMVGKSPAHFNPPACFFNRGH